MNNELTLENFISGDIFSEGLNNTLLKEPVEVEKTFMVLFSSSESKILASSKSLENTKDIFFKKNDNSSGGVLTVNPIKAEYTKSYVLEGSTSIADGFALIRANGASQQVSDGLNVEFPNLELPYSILIKGKLSNTPVVSGSSSFKFNKTTIEFGV